MSPGNGAGREFFLLPCDLGVGIRGVRLAFADSLQTRGQISREKQSAKLYAGDRRRAFDRGVFLGFGKDSIDDCRMSSARPALSFGTGTVAAINVDGASTLR